MGITHGDINGVGYEVILKTFSDPTMLELCTPVVYGSPKVAAYHRKAMEIQTSFSIVNSAEEVQDGRVNVVNCIEEELKVELTKPTPEAGKAALAALERALADYREGLFDVLVTAPINKHTIQSDAFHFPGHTEYIEERVGEGQKALMILLKGDFRVALVTGHVPVRDIAGELTKELIMERWRFPSFTEERFRHRQSAYCRVLTESSCGRQRTAGNGRAGSDYSGHEGNDSSWRAVLRAVSCRWFHGFRQLYAFRRYSGHVS